MLGATSPADHLGSLSGPAVHCAAVDAEFVTQVASAAAEADFARFEIDLLEVRTKAQLLRRFAEAMRFPSYFGSNWDALLDCLRDMSWVDGDKYLVTITGFDEFQASCSADARVLIEILAQAVSDWRSYDQLPFFALVLSSSCSKIAEGTSVEVCNHLT